MSEPQPPQGAATSSPLRRQAPKRTPGYLLRRAWERSVYASYRLLMGLIGILPPRPVEALFAAVAPLAYLLWPAKRRIADGNAAVVLGVADAEGRLYLVLVVENLMVGKHVPNPVKPCQFVGARLVIARHAGEEFVCVA